MARKLRKHPKQYSDPLTPPVSPHRLKSFLSNQKTEPKEKKADHYAAKTVDLALLKAIQDMPILRGKE